MFRLRGCIKVRVKRRVQATGLLFILLKCHFFHFLVEGFLSFFLFEKIQVLDFRFRYGDILSESLVGL